MFYVDRPVPRCCVSPVDSCPYKEVCEVYQKELHDDGVPFDVYASRCIDRRHPDCEIKTDIPASSKEVNLLQDFREIVEARIQEREKELEFYRKHNVPEVAERYKHDIFIYRWVIENIKKLESNN